MVRIVRRLGGAPPSSKGSASATKIDSARVNPVNQRQQVFPDWSPRNNGPHKETVEVYGNCKEIELFLNGKSLGVKPRADDDEPRIWQVAFEPGVLRAVGMNDGLPVAAHELKTAAASAAISLASDLNSLPLDWDQVACVRAQIVDSAGTLIPDASDLVKFRVSGPGVIAAVDSASNSSHEPFQGSERRAFNGQCVVWVRATAAGGPITVTATVAGLPSATVVLNATSPK
jgi:beta-galactosidase